MPPPSVFLCNPEADYWGLHLLGFLDDFWVQPMEVPMGEGKVRGEGDFPLIFASGLHLTVVCSSRP